MFNQNLNELINEDGNKALPILSYLLAFATIILIPLLI